MFRQILNRIWRNLKLKIIKLREAANKSSFLSSPATKAFSPPPPGIVAIGTFFPHILVAHSFSPTPHSQWPGQKEKNFFWWCNHGYEFTCNLGMKTTLKKNIYICKIRIFDFYTFFFIVIEDNAYLYYNSNLQQWTHKIVFECFLNDITGKVVWK